MLFERGNGRGILIGALIGVTGAAVGYTVYKKNQDKVDTFLKSKGIDMPSGSSKDYSSMSMEDLVINKERIEDVIAEKEAAQKGKK
ncbi:MAG: hypothetical protein PQJ50_05680 [Spirochaetales bacterium]|nr:hypothetical protein [Spirochaetales bacterium]